MWCCGVSRSRVGFGGGGGDAASWAREPVYQGISDEGAVVFGELPDCVRSGGGDLFLHGFPGSDTRAQRPGTGQVGDRLALKAPVHTSLVAEPQETWQHGDVALKARFIVEAGAAHATVPQSSLYY